MTQIRKSDILGLLMASIIIIIIRVDARIVNNRDKQVIALEMSCPWVSNRDKKTFEKTMKYAPLRWELRQRYPGYEINQCNIILDVLGDGPRTWMSPYRS